MDVSRSRKNSAAEKADLVWSGAKGMEESIMSLASNTELLQTSRDAAKNTSAYKRISLLFDEGTFNEIDAFAKSGDKAAEAIVGFGTVEGCPAYVFAQNSDVDGGAMSKAQASKIKKIYDLAVKTGAPVIGIYDSIGGRLNEGGDMVAAYGEILLHSNNLSGVVPQIALVLGPCIGTSAMIAAGSDVVVMSKKAELAIEAGSENSSAEEAAKIGVCQIVSETEEEAIAKVRTLVTSLPSNNLSGAPIVDALGMNSAAPLTAAASTRDVITAISDDETFIEFGKQFGTSVITGIAQVTGTTTGFVAYENEICADACAKAARFVRFCDAFAIPVVSIVNAKGFHSLREASKLSNAYSEATTAKVTVITGEAYGPVYIAVAGRGAGADVTMAWASASVSPISPATGAMFLWNDRLAGSSNPVEDRKKLIKEYKEKETCPLKAAAEGYIEDVILPEETRAKVVANLEMLSGKRVSRLPKKHANIQM